ncbi:MAG: glycosyltransferase family 117 protein [Gemmatirosa sp.]
MFATPLLDRSDERPTSRIVLPSARLLAGAGLLAIVAGYVDLWRGGVSAAAVLLVLGYCVLLPAAIWASRPRPPSAEQAPPPYAVAGIVGLAVLALYVATLAPTTAMWDASEYIAVAKVLGLPHPPGNPLFVLMAHVAGLLPIPVSYAARINLLAAAASAASAALWFLCTERALRTTLPGRVSRYVAAGAGSLIGATAFTVWNQSVVNEKVYTVSLLGLALTSWLVMRWLDAQGAVDASPAHARDAAVARGDRLLVVMAFVAGLGYAVHPAGFLTGPAVAAAVLSRRPGALLRWRLLVALGAALVAALTLFAVEPIRSAHLPAINEGMPTACEGGAPRLDCTLSAETGRRLLSNVRREQYGGHPVMARKAPFDAQLAMWWLYFEWQWLRDSDGERPGAQRALALLFLSVAIVGLVALRRRERAAWWYLAPLAVTLTLALVFYLNFNYGYSQSPALGDTVPREVRDRDYFFVWTFSAWGMFAALGLAALWRWAADAMTARGVPARRALLLAAPVLTLAVVPALGNARAASRAGQTFTRDWAVDLLNSVEPYGVLITNGDNDSFPLWYAQQVEGVRRDVTIALVPYLGLPWYARQLLQQPPEAYDAARGPALYAASAATRPTTPLWALTPREADAIPDYVELTSPQRFRHGEMDVTVPAGVLTRDQLLVLRAIKDSFPERPLYFSSAGYPAAMGFSSYLRQQGLAYRLEPRALTESDALVPVGGVHLDLPRSRALWATTYRGAAALVREGQWVDRASVSIPVIYALTGQQLATALVARGDTAGASQVAREVNALARATRLTSE